MFQKKIPSIILTVIFILSPLFIAQSNESFTITLGGDVMLGRFVPNKIIKNSTTHVWGDLWPIFHNADFTLVNQEFVLTHSSNKWNPKTFHFKAPPFMVNHLKAAGIDAVSLANNHMLDYGNRGLKHTLKQLRLAPILFGGAGPNLQESQKPFYFKAKDKTVAVISFTDNMPEWSATQTKPGTFYLPITISSIAILTPLIHQARNQGADWVIASIHWGGNWNERPPPSFREFSHALLDAGVDIIHGHSTHTIQGIEIYKGKPIFYGMGDVIDDYEVTSWRNDLAYLAQVQLEESRIKEIRLYPTRIHNFQAGLAKEKDFDWVTHKLQKLSAEWGTQITQKQDYLVVELFDGI